jgi:hypothetical protein
MIDDGKVLIDVTMRVTDISPDMRRHYRRLCGDGFPRAYANYLIAGAVYITGDGVFEVNRGKSGWSRHDH